ncbi:helix-turn-helix domain-containing protein [Bombilactobacillus bombi]|uniref:helix-turn-helix domain-containing protein n=1 Tax=Bombilactobacillus bombi TaxID=1303590 RepID=UPI0015E616F6|nr:helix-turn-helix transcriptional regulator [Bombilactobacillus bombi]MBA1434535.1 XRE family transcriptional regulator [Bombilactobacillus bombi]
MLFSKRLKITRQSLNLTQEKVASQLHVTQQTISSWENGRSYPDIDSLIQISDYYQISLDTLLKEDTGMKEEIKKSEVLHTLRPTFIATYLINIICLVALLLMHFIDKQQQTPLYVFYGLIVITIINAISLAYLKVFIKKRLASKSMKSIIFKGWLLLILGIVGVILLIVRIPIFYGGTYFGILAALTIIFYLNKYSHNN